MKKVIIGLVILTGIVNLVIARSLEMKKVDVETSEVSVVCEDSLLSKGSF